MVSAQSNPSRSAHRGRKFTRNYSQVFFDDEHRNKEVQTLGKHVRRRLIASDQPTDPRAGVTFALVRKDFTERTFEEGLAEWRKRHPAEVTEDAGGDDVKGI